MKKSIKFFDVFPLTVEAGSQAVIRIRPRFEHAVFPPPDQFRVRIFPCMGAMPDGRQLDFGWGKQDDPLEFLEWRLDNGELVVKAHFHGEQAHLISVEKTDGTSLWDFYVYSLEPDYYRLRPFKGDFHMHTNASDGQECSEYVAARYREAGFDFIAITDHHHYEPSVKAREYWNRYSTGLAIYPGEEVHPPDCPVHIVNFGGSFSVNEIFRQDEAAFRREVEARIPGLGPVTPGVSPFAVATTEWVFDKIREGGGLAVYCHPYWDIRGINVLSGALIDEIFKRRKFDAFEVIGGFWKHQSDSNLYQIIRNYQEWASAGEFPVVGLSDSHGTERDGLYGWYYTIVLAESDSLADLIQSIRACRSVAVDAPKDERLHCHGNYRMVRYAQFLIHEYFPRHEALCRTEGEAMLDSLGGDSTITDTIAILSKRPACYRDSAFQKN